ncbi:hypothetical protein [Burkholderia metallica]|uniref:hypothetical protein n=1 Tax=Burkholderia metallica TaxID=488729 RepID=UPI001FC7BCB2|nr:hypothetical protein [Burkholderia metallica]
MAKDSRRPPRHRSDIFLAYIYVHGTSPVCGVSNFQGIPTMAAKRLRINMITRRQSTFDGRHLDNEAVRRFDAHVQDAVPAHLKGTQGAEAEWLPRVKVSQR